MVIPKNRGGNPYCLRRNSPEKQITFCNDYFVAYIYLLKFAAQNTHYIYNNGIPDCFF